MNALDNSIEVAIENAIAQYVQAFAREHIDLNVNDVNIHVYVHEVPGTPVKANLFLGGKMPGQITVDTTNETATVEFRDDKGDVTAAPAGAVVTFTSSDAAVLTVATDPNNPLQGDVTPVALGTADVGADITGAVEPSGSPFTVAAQTVTVGPGPAATADLVLSV